VSTVLDALKKVEQERQSPRGQLLHVPPPEPNRPRHLSAGVIAACAALGFAAGIGFALWRDAPPIEPRELPGVPPPPAIHVPAPPAPVIAAAPPVASDPSASAVDADSALEPSPFAPPRSADSSPGEAAAPSRAAGRSAPPAPAPPPNSVAALAPQAPFLPPEADLPPVAPEEPTPQPDSVTDTGRSPPGSPRVSLSFLQWSADPARRFAFVSIDGAPTQRVREGDTATGLTVAEITATGVQFKQDGKLFTIRPRH